MPNSSTCSTTDIPVTTTAAARKVLRAKVAVESVTRPALPASPARAGRKAWTIDFHENANEVSAAVTIIATPGHNNQASPSVNQTLEASLPGATQPFSNASGANQPHATTDPNNIEIPTLGPIKAPTAYIIVVGSRAKPRFAGPIPARPAFSIAPPGLAVHHKPPGLQRPSAATCSTILTAAAATAAPPRILSRAAAWLPLA